jgi:uncharacterized Fe-S cluster-containing protein
MKQIEKLLPGYNCGECGLASCQQFARALEDVSDLTRCPVLEQERFKGRAQEIARFLAVRDPQDEIIGVLDGLQADLSLAPLPGEPSCREDLYPFDRSVILEAGEFMRYRPLGCPVTHFARVLKYNHSIATVHLIGPRHLIDKSPLPREVGICMVAGFEGVVNRGRIPDVGETVRFLPEHCMMQKVHSGVVVHSEGRKLRIEGIDLKVW